MSNFFDYMMKVSLCYGVIYLFYLLLLKPLTHYKGNRFFLLASSVLVFFIPLLRIDFFVTPEKINSSPFINSIPSFNTNSAAEIFIPANSSANFSSIIFALFITGVVICAFHFIVQLKSFKKIRAAAQFINEIEGIELYHLTTDIIPFSFGNAIYINKLSHSEDELKEIIRHESVHVRQKHTIDVLIAEFICILNWYNPFAWLIKRAIKQNLEFLADDGVIKTGADKKSYQYLLLKVMGTSPLAIASSLNFSSLKNRIYMMNKTKTSKKHLLKFLFVLPAVVLMILAFRDDSKTVAAKPIVSANDETYKLSEVTYSISDPAVETIVKKEQKKSLLQVGQPFTVGLIKKERDRLKLLLEKNGYNNINTHSISFLIDSTLSNDNFSIQVNIDLSTKSSVSKNKSNGKLNAVTRGIDSKSFESSNSNYSFIESTFSSNQLKISA